MKGFVFGMAAAAVVVCAPAFGAGALLTQINASDLIVIGETADAGSVANGVLSLAVNIQGTLKGSAPAGNLSVHFALGSSGPQTAISGVAGRCGIFFLVQDAGQWSLVPRNQPQFTLGDLFYPEGSCGAVAAPASPAPSADGIVTAVIQAIQSGTPSDQDIIALFNALPPADSPSVALAAAQISSGAQRGLQILSLGWRLSLGEDEALGEVSAWIPALNQSAIGVILASAVSGYTGTTAAAAKGLGEIAMQGSGTGFEMPASMALRSLHTAAALPYLLQLLDSADPRVRLNAVAGLSMSLAGVPPLTSGASPQAVMEKALNPAFRKQLSAEDQAHLQFASLGDAASEAALIAWWKIRAQQMVAAGQ